MYHRNHVEEMITNRLLRKLPTDIEVSAELFREVTAHLDVVFSRVLLEVTIPSFTEEDLISFMLMKTHQMLRRQKVDLTRKNWHTLFYSSFKNLCIDIYRMQERALNGGMDADPLDTVADRELDTEKGESVRSSLMVFIEQQEVYFELSV